MEINELKKLQTEGLKKEELLLSIKNHVEVYNSKCEEFASRFSLVLSNIALQDVQNFLQNSTLKYSKLTDHRFLIDGTGIEILTTDEGFTIAVKDKELYKTFIVELETDSQPKGFVNKCINIKGNLISTDIGNSFNKILEQSNIDDLESISDTLKNALNDVEMAMEDIMSTGDTSYNYEYYEYKNEDNRYKTIDVIFDSEI